MDRNTADRWCERGILGLLLGILIYAPLAMGAVRPSELLVVEFLTAGIGVLWIARIWISEEAKLYFPPIAWSVMAFLLYAFWQYYHADIEYVARQELLRVLIYSFLFLAIINNLNRSESAQWVSVAMVVLGGAMAAYGIFQFMTKAPRIWEFNRPLQYLARGSGTFINPNHFSGFLEMILPLGIAYTFWSRLSHLAKIFIGYATIVILVGIGVSLSRGGWAVAAFTILGSVLMLIGTRRSRLQIVVVTAAVACLAVAFVNTSWFQQRIDRFYSSGRFYDQRPLFWKAAIQMWREEPWTGVGPGHFDYRYGKFRAPIIEAQFQPQYVHNDYLNALSDWGIIGVLIIGTTIVLLVAGGVKSWRQLREGQGNLGRRRSRREAFFIGGSLGVLAILIHSFVDFNLQVPSNAILFVTLIALLTGLRLTGSKLAGTEWNLGGRIAATIVLLAASGWLVSEAFNTYREHKCLREAEGLKDKPLERVAALKMAHAVESGNFRTTYVIGELLRLQSFAGDGDYRKLAREAMDWFERGMYLNRYDARNYVRYGMCLDWLGQHDKAKAFFEKALEFEPNHYFVAAYMGWHFMQVDNYDQAERWFRRSLQLYDNHMNRNPMPGIYLQMIERRRREAAQPPIELSIPPSP